MTVHSEAQDAIARAAEESRPAPAREKADGAAVSICLCSLTTACGTRSGQFIGGSVREERSDQFQLWPPVTVARAGADGRRHADRCSGGTLGKVEATGSVDLIDQGIHMRHSDRWHSGFGPCIRRSVVALTFGRIFKKTGAGLEPGSQISIILGPRRWCRVTSPSPTLSSLTRGAHVCDRSDRRGDRREGDLSTSSAARRSRNFQSGVAHHMADTEEGAIDYDAIPAGLLPSSCEVTPPRIRIHSNPGLRLRRAVADLVPTSGASAPRARRGAFARRPQ